MTYKSESDKISESKKRGVLYHMSIAGVFSRNKNSWFIALNKIRL